MLGIIGTRIDDRDIAFAHHIGVGASEGEGAWIVGHQPAYARRNLTQLAIFKVDRAVEGKIGSFGFLVSGLVMSGAREHLPHDQLKHNSLRFVCVGGERNHGMGKGVRFTRLIENPISDAPQVMMMLSSPSLGEGANANLCA